MCVVSFRPRPLLPRVNSALSSNSRFGCFGEERNLFRMPGTEQALTLLGIHMSVSVYVYVCIYIYIYKHYVHTCVLADE